MGGMAANLVLFLVAVFVIVAVLWDTFETMILPRRVTRAFRLARLFYRTTWVPWSAVACRLPEGKKREAFLSVFGPLSLLLLFSMWAFGLILGFALLHAAMGSPLNAPDGPPGFWTDLYLSGTTFFTLGLGDVTPGTTGGRVAIVIECGIGFGFLAVLVS